ncbi:ATP-binding protein [Caenispirillum salinarum]|uniref:hybrid sensor histidine kinase/response regulator n=1 Tax=Caenispirillum salinarum TaxID=859058 RepID=UPI0038516214
MADLLAEHTLTTLRNIGGLLGQVETIAVESDLLSGPLSGNDRIRVLLRLRDLVPAHPAAEAVYVLDRRGRLVAASQIEDGIGIGLSDRPYFQEAMAAEPGAVSMARTVVARAAPTEHERVSLVTRPIADAGGTVLGVAVAVLSNDLYLNMVEAVPPGRDGAIGLYMRDGTFLMGVPSMPMNRIGTETALAVAAGPGTGARAVDVRLSDDVERIGAVAPVPEFPLLVFVGESTAALLAAEWRPRALAAAALAAFLLLALVTAAGATALGNRRRVMEIAKRHAADHALAEREGMMDMIMDTLADGVLVLDAAGRVVRSNRCAGEMFGRASDGLRGLPVSNLIREADGPNLDDRLASIRRVGASVSHALTALNRPRGVRPDGTDFSADLSVGIWDQDGESLCTVAVRDRTDSERAEEYVRRTGKMDAVGRMAGGVAHDFNNLLGIILGNLDLLAGDVGETRARRLGAARRAATRAAGLTKKLLTFSRAHPLAAVTVDVNREVSESQALLTQAVTGHWNLDVQLCDTALPVKVDPGELEDALLNLVLNARDAMPDGGRIIIETGRRWLDPDFATAQNLCGGAYVVITVSDNGIGMAPEAKDRIFEPFFTTKANGTGLGLAAVYGFVRRSGGTIRVYTEPGYGTTMRILLPQVSDGAIPAPSEDLSADDLTGNGEVILIVEDEVDLRDLADIWLTRRGYVTLNAASAEEALAILENPRTRVDLLFTDIVLPGGRNGDELSLLAVALRPELKVVLTSGFTWAAWSTQRPAGPQPFPMLPKPYGHRDLQAAVHDVMHNGDDACPRTS